MRRLPDGPGPDTVRTHRKRRRNVAAARDAASAETIQKHRDDLTWILGTPGQAVDQIREVLERSRSGIISFYATDEKISHADNLRNIELLGQHVIRAMRDIGDELGLKSPFALS